MEIKIINTYNDGAYYVVIYRYWVKGECACTSEQITRTFTEAPTTEDLINAI